MNNAKVNICVLAGVFLAKIPRNELLLVLRVCGFLILRVDLAEFLISNRSITDDCLTSFFLDTIADIWRRRKNSGLGNSKSPSRPNPATNRLGRHASLPSLWVGLSFLVCKMMGLDQLLSLSSSCWFSEFGAEGSYLGGPQPLYQRDEVKWGIFGFQAFHADLQTLPFCKRSSRAENETQGTRGKRRKGKLSGDH